MTKKKSGPNKSEAIRQAYKVLPQAKAKEIVAYLKEKGVEVTDGLVYQVKKISKKKKRGPKLGKAPQMNATAVPSKNGVVSVGASIAAVKATAEKVGGWKSLKEIVDALQ